MDRDLVEPAQRGEEAFAILVAVRNGDSPATDVAELEAVVGSFAFQP